MADWPAPRRLLQAAAFICCGVGVSVLFGSVSGCGSSGNSPTAPSTLPPPPSVVNPTPQPTTTNVTIYTNPAFPEIAVINSNDGGKGLYLGTKDSQGLPLTVSDVLVGSADPNRQSRVHYGADGRPLSGSIVTGAGVSINWQSAQEAKVTLVRPDGGAVTATVSLSSRSTANVLSYRALVSGPTLSSADACNALSKVFKGSCGSYSDALSSALGDIAQAQALAAAARGNLLTWLAWADLAIWSFNYGQACELADSYLRGQCAASLVSTAPPPTPAPPPPPPPPPSPPATPVPTEPAAPCADGGPTSLLAPVAGPLRVTRTNLGTRDGLWEFNQHQTGFHRAGGGISGSDDTFAWDINWYTQSDYNADVNQPVRATADGEVVDYAGLLPGASSGAVLVAHPNKANANWWSGYLHMTAIAVSVGDRVTPNTVIGRVGREGANNDHLHFVGYRGRNAKSGLCSFDAAFIERPLVPPQGSFSVSISPDARTVTRGSSTTFTATIQSLNGFSSPVQMFALNLPGDRVIAGTAWSPGTVTPPANGSVTSTFTLATDSLTPTGPFTITFEGRSSGITRSDTATVTVNAGAAPTLLIDGGTSSNRQIGRTFNFTGTGYTPGGTVTRYITPAINGSNVLLPTIAADSGGNISWSFTPGCGNPYGIFAISALDDTTNRGSNSVSENVISSASAGFQLSSVSPTSVTAGTFDMTLLGSGFDGVAIDQVFWKATGGFVGNGTILSRTSTQIVVRQFMTGASTGTYQVRVKNCDTLSNPLEFQVR